MLYNHFGEEPKLGETITIIDIGRGPQLSSRRLTIQDLLPFFKRGSSNPEISRWYPQVEPFEIELLRQYYLDHVEELLKLEREIAARNLDARKVSHPPELPTDGMSSHEKRQWMLERLAKRGLVEQELVHGSAR